MFCWLALDFGLGGDLLIFVWFLGCLVYGYWFVCMLLVVAFAWHFGFVVLGLRLYRLDVLVCLRWAV